MPEPMNEGRDAVLGALDAAEQPVSFFMRDDDAGWDDTRLFALLDCVLGAGAAIDLAVIPQAASDALARELRARVDDAPDRIGLHQHGFAHANHETEGRKCEFGTGRDLAAQRLDLSRGRERLQALFAHGLDPVFTPPWNRCSAQTPALLAELGYGALSRDRSAPAQADLPELRVDVDWCRLRRADTAGGGLPVAAELARRIGSGATVGLMLHHAQMDETDLALLGGWLASWARHPRARWTSMRSLLAERLIAGAANEVTP